MKVQHRTDRELRRRWRRQMAAHLDPHYVEARRGFAAISFVDDARTTSTFIDINNLTVFLLYEDVPSRTGGSPLRFSAYRACWSAGGVRWGGTENGNCVLDKNLSLSPQFEARGLRIDRRKYDMIDTALRLDRRLAAAARHPAAPWRELQLPKLWAGFRANRATELRIDGLPLEQQCRCQSSSREELISESSRRVDGLIAYPLGQVASDLPSAVAVFAELTLSVRRQVCRIRELPGGLIGFQGAAYDFYSSSFRQESRTSTRTSRVARRRPPYKKGDRNCRRFGRVNCDVV